MQFKSSFLAALVASVAAAAPAPSLQLDHSNPIPGTVELTPRQGVGSVFVVNECSFTVFVRSQTNTGTGALSTLSPGGTYAQKFQMPASGGTAILVARSDPSTFPSRLTVEYSISGSTIFYDVSLVNGNPFQAQGFDLSPRNVPGCADINCPANVANCNGSGSQTKTCSEAANLQLNLCKPL
ncbi:hypothetical protein MMC10_008222 [Thelotrema lepadinum]|nr:hypothetical protein [Thelotrema lepadinum]